MGFHSSLLSWKEGLLIENCAPVYKNDLFSFLRQNYFTPCLPTCGLRKGVKQVRKNLGPLVNCEVSSVSALSEKRSIIFRMKLTKHLLTGLILVAALVLVSEAIRVVRPKPGGAGSVGTVTKSKDPCECGSDNRSRICVCNLPLTGKSCTKKGKTIAHRDVRYWMMK